ncbi:MAG: hypothetical protein ABIE55_01595 [Candidatus Aenigmatarchaeota archaeon]
MNNKIIAAILGLLMVASPALAWNVNIDATVNNAVAGIFGAGAGSDTGFSYAVSSTGGISGSGNIDLHGGGSNNGGGMGLEIGGSGAEGNIFATHDLTVIGCCAGQCPCPTGYVYDASSAVEITGGDNVELELKGGAGEEGAGQKLKVGGHDNSIDAGTVQVEMASSLTVDGETSSHVMGAYGENVWFKAFGKQKLDAVDCAVNGFFVSVMGFREAVCDGDNCD